jgi:hypothetical protein
MGVQGVQGIQGIQGATGIRGATGTQGIQGTTGPVANLQAAYKMGNQITLTGNPVQIANALSGTTLGVSQGQSGDCALQVDLQSNSTTPGVVIQEHRSDQGPKPLVILYTPSTDANKVVLSISQAGGANSRDIQGSGGSWYIQPNGLFKVGVFNNAIRPTAGVAGRIIFNTTTHKLQVDDGSAWHDVQTS